MRTVNLTNGETVVVRPWQEHDIPRLYDLMRQVSKEADTVPGAQPSFAVDQLYQQFYYYSPEAHLTLVAVRSDGEVAGWIHCNRSPMPWMGHNAFVWMGVAPSMSNYGVGEEMMKEAFAWASARGIERLELSLRGSNKAELSLYEKMGFHEEGRKLRSIKTETGYDDDILMGVFLDANGHPKKLKTNALAKKRTAKSKNLKPKRN